MAYQSNLSYHVLGYGPWAKDGFYTLKLLHFKELCKYLHNILNLASWSEKAKIFITFIFNKNFANLWTRN